MPVERIKVADIPFRYEAAQQPSGPVASIELLYNSYREIYIDRAIDSGEWGAEEADMDFVGLGCIADVACNLLARKPDVLYLESTLLYQPLQSEDTIRDFIRVRFSGTTVDLDGRVQKIADAYQRVYVGLRDKLCTLYHLRRWSKSPSAMQLVWSRFDVSAPQYEHSSGSQANFADTAVSKRSGLRERIRELGVEGSPQFFRRRSGDYEACQELPVGDEGRGADDDVVDAADRSTKDGRPRRSLVAGDLPVDDVKLNADLFHSSMHEQAFGEYPISYCWCIPIVGANDGSNDPGTMCGLGLLFMIAVYRSEDCPIGEDVHERIGRSTSYIMKDIIGPYMNSAALRALKNARQAALKTGISTILGRVNAHDLSHVLINAKLPDNAVDRVFFFKHFADYLRLRMVFVADAGGEPAWAVSLPLMLQVFAPFQYYSAQDESKISATCEYLGHSEGINKVLINVIKDGKSLKIRRDKASGSWRCEPELYVSIPHGTVGTHGLYCLLENIIRNGAKYGQKNQSKTLTLNLRISTQPNATLDPKIISDHFEIEAWEDRSTFSEEHFANIRHFFPPAGGSNGTRSDPIDPACLIVDEQGKLVPSGLGLKEMRIVSTWLLMQPLETLDPRYKPKDRDQAGDSGFAPGLMPVRIEHDGQEYMGYRFYLLKPKDLLILDHGTSRPDSEGIGRLAMQGIDFNRLSELGDQPVRHGACLLNQKASEDPRATASSTDLLRDKRSFLPALTGLHESMRSDDLDRVRPPIAFLSDEEFDPIIRALQKGEREVVLLRAFHACLQKLLGVDARARIILNLRSAPGVAVADSIAGPWQRVSDILGKEFGVKMRVLNAAPGEDYGFDEEGDAIVCDWHGTWLNDFQAAKSPDFPFVYEPFGRNNQLATRVLNPADEWTNLKLALEMLAATAPAAIVDERCYRKWADGIDLIKYEQRLELGFFCEGGDTEADNRFYKSPTPEHFESLVDECVKRNVRILSIHQSMLDKAFIEGGGNKPDTIRKFIVDASESIPFVMVHSDRGKSMLAHRPPETPFLPFSAIEPFLLGDGISKVHLVATLLAARR